MWSKFQWFLDWLGRGQTALWLFALITGATVSGAVGVLSETPFWALALLFLASGMIALGGLIAWQNYRNNSKAKHGEQKATLKIKYSDDAANRRYMRFEGNGGPCTWYLEIVNESVDNDAQDVEIKVESSDQIPDLLMPHARTAAFTLVGRVLTFERGGQARTIRRQDSEWVKFLSFDRQVPRRWIQIGEYTQGSHDLHGKIVQVYTPHRIDVTVRSANANPIMASFLVKAESEMLEVRML